jgi:hypothetical protein
MSARWENACGKFPIMPPRLASYSSAKRHVDDGDESRCDISPCTQ